MNLTNRIPKIIYEDDDILVIDKPAGLIAHEGAGKEKWTVEKWLELLHRTIPECYSGKPEGLIRNPDYKLDSCFRRNDSIVHRLDKDTSGLMVIAKTQEAVEDLKNQFAQRQVRKEYTTLVLGKVEPSKGVISGKIGRSPKDRQKMAVLYLGKGREARTEYEAIKYYCHSGKPKGLIRNPDYKLDSCFRRNDKQILSLLKVFPKTGRMHQIRVHLNYFGYPVIGDQKYFTKISRRVSKDLGLTRQFLHASRLEFKHPRTGGKVKFESELPEELVKLLC